MERLRDGLPLLGWFASLAAGIVLFLQLGDGPLATPPLTEPGAWSAWAAERDAVIAGLAVARLLVLGLAWYLVGVTTIGLIARLLRLASLVRLADAMSGPVVRHVLRQALGVSLAVGVVASSTGAGPRSATPTDAGVDRAVATAVVLDEASHPGGDGDLGEATVRAIALDEPAIDGAGAARDTRPSRGGVVTERMVGLPPALQDVEIAERLDPDEEADPEAGPGPEVESDAPDATGPVTVDEPQAPAVDAVPADEHEVVAGEHLWSIAEATVRDALGGEVSESQLVTYWQALIADNRDRLADPDNPDLLFPGQQLRLPDVERTVHA